MILLAELTGDDRPVGYECAGLHSTNETEELHIQSSMHRCSPPEAQCQRLTDVADIRHRTSPAPAHARAPRD
jgi:hypothetical protein